MTTQVAICSPITSPMNNDSMSKSRTIRPGNTDIMRRKNKCVEKSDSAASEPFSGRQIAHTYAAMKKKHSTSHLWDPMRTTPPFRRPSCRVAEAAFDRGVAVAESPTSPRREDHWFHTQGTPPAASGRFRSEEWHLIRHSDLRDLVCRRRRRRHRPPAGTPGISAGNLPNSSSTRRSRIGRWR